MILLRHVMLAQVHVLVLLVMRLTGCRDSLTDDELFEQAINVNASFKEPLQRSGGKP